MRGRKNPIPNQNTPNLPPCKVCGEQGTGFHYGVTTCGACKGFFRRSLVRNEPYICTGNAICHIGPETKRRKSCPRCRYEKCLAVGMCKEAIKTGRYSYVKKSQDIVEMIEHQIKSFSSSEQQSLASACIPQECFHKNGEIPQKKVRSSCALDKCSTPIKLRPSEYMEVSPTKLDMCAENVFQFENIPPGNDILLSTCQNGEMDLLEALDSEVTRCSSEMNTSSCSSSSLDGSISNDLQSMSGMSDQLVTSPLQYNLWDVLPPLSPPILLSSSAVTSLIAPTSSEILHPSSSQSVASINSTSPLESLCAGSEQTSMYSQSNSQTSSARSVVYSGESDAFSLTDDTLIGLGHSDSGTTQFLDLSPRSIDPFFTMDFNDSVKSKFENKEKAFSNHQQNLHPFPATSNPQPRFETADEQGYPTLGEEMRMGVSPDVKNSLLTHLSFEIECFRHVSKREEEGALNQAISLSNSVPDSLKTCNIPANNSFLDSYTFVDNSSATRPPQTELSTYEEFGHKSYWDLDDNVSNTQTDFQFFQNKVSGQSSFQNCGSRADIVEDEGYPLSKFTHFLGNNDNIVHFPEISGASNSVPISFNATSLPSSHSSPLMYTSQHNCLSSSSIDGIIVKRKNLESFRHPSLEVLTTPIHRSVSGRYSTSSSPESGDPFRSSSDLVIPADTFHEVSLETPHFLTPLQHSTQPTSSTSTTQCSSDSQAPSESSEFHRKQMEQLQEDMLRKWMPFKSENETFRIKQEEDCVKLRLHDNEEDYHKKPLSWCEFTEAELDDIVQSLKSAHHKHVGVSTCQLTDDEISEREDCFLNMMRMKEEVYGKFYPLEVEDYFQILETTGIDLGGRKECQEAIATTLDKNLEKIIRFFRSIPGFKEICQEDKILLAKASMTEYSVIGNFRGVNFEKKTILDAELEVALSCDFFHCMFPDTTQHMDGIFRVSKKLKELKLSFEDIIILRAISLISPDRVKLKEFEKVDRIYWKLHCCLLLSFWRCRSEPLKDYAKVISILTDLRIVNHEGREMMNKNKAHILRMTKHVQAPLYLEMFFTDLEIKS